LGFTARGPNRNQLPISTYCRTFLTREAHKCQIGLVSAARAPSTVTICKLEKFLRHNATTSKVEHRASTVGL
jgi:hypothetical protein